MSAPRRAAARDANEAGIVRAFKRMGWRVVRHTEYDLDVCCPFCRCLLAVEVKNAEGRNRSTERQDALRESGWPLPEVRNTREVEKFVEIHVSACGRKRADWSSLGG